MQLTKLWTLKRIWNMMIHVPLLIMIQQIQDEKKRFIYRLVSVGAIALEVVMMIIFSFSLKAETLEKQQLLRKLIYSVWIRIIYMALGFWLLYLYRYEPHFNSEIFLGILAFQFLRHQIFLHKNWKIKVLLGGIVLLTFGFVIFIHESGKVEGFLLIANTFYGEYLYNIVTIKLYEKQLIKVVQRVTDPTHSGDINWQKEFRKQNLREGSMLISVDRQLLLCDDCCKEFLEVQTDDPQVILDAFFKSRFMKAQDLHNFFQGSISGDEIQELTINSQVISFRPPQNDFRFAPVQFPHEKSSLKTFKNIPDRSLQSELNVQGELKAKMNEMFREFLNDAEVVKVRQETIYIKKFRMESLNRYYDLEITVKFNFFQPSQEAPDVAPPQLDQNPHQPQQLVAVVSFKELQEEDINFKRNLNMICEFLSSNYQFNLDGGGGAGGSEVVPGDQYHPAAGYSPLQNFSHTYNNLLIKQVLDLNSIQKGVLHLALSLQDIEKFSRILRENFLPLSRQKSIDLNIFNTLPAKTTLRTDFSMINRLTTLMIWNLMKIVDADMDTRFVEFYLERGENEQEDHVNLRFRIKHRLSKCEEEQLGFLFQIAKETCRYLGKRGVSSKENFRVQASLNEVVIVMAIFDHTRANIVLSNFGDSNERHSQNALYLDQQPGQRGKKSDALRKISSAEYFGASYSPKFNNQHLAQYTPQPSKQVEKNLDFAFDPPRRASQSRKLSQNRLLQSRGGPYPQKDKILHDDSVIGSLIENEQPIRQRLPQDSGQLNENMKQSFNRRQELCNFESERRNQFALRLERSPEEDEGPRFNQGEDLAERNQTRENNLRIEINKPSNELFSLGLIQVQHEPVMLDQVQVDLEKNQGENTSLRMSVSFSRLQNQGGRSLDKNPFGQSQELPHLVTPTNNQGNRESMNNSQILLLKDREQSKESSHSSQSQNLEDLKDPEEFDSPDRLNNR